LSQHIYQRRPVNDSAIPDVIFLLLIANALVYAAQYWAPQFMYEYFALWSIGSYRGQFMPWQLVTYGFMHDTYGLSHILFNMFVGAGVVQLIAAWVTNADYLTVGASGGVFGILLAYAMTFPNRTVVLLIPPIPMKAKYFVLLYGLLNLYQGLSGTAQGVANFAHLGGMLFGFLLIQHWRNGRRR